MISIIWVDLGCAKVLTFKHTGDPKFVTSTKYILPWIPSALYLIVDRVEAAFLILNMLHIATLVNDLIPLK